MDVVPPHHSAVFSSGLFSVLLPSLTFGPSTAPMYQFLQKSVLLPHWKRPLQDLGLAHLVLASFTIFHGMSDTRFITRQNKKQILENKED